MRNVCDIYREFWHVDPVPKGNGEFCAPICPRCGEGEDRLLLFPERVTADGSYRGGYAWCRKCNAKFPAPDLYMEATGATIAEALAAVGLKGGTQRARSYSARRMLPNTSPRPKERALPPALWRERAKAFVASCLAWRDATFSKWLADRQLTVETANRLYLGFNPRYRKDDPAAWGLPTVKDDGTPHPVHLPRGYVIPQIVDGEVVSITIRRANWKAGDAFGKYQHVRGGYTGPHVLGTEGRPVVMTEGALDAILLYQAAGDVVTCVALKSAQTPPDTIAHEVLKAAPVVLSAMDSDDAGDKGLERLEKSYRAEFLPVIEGKDPTEQAAAGVDTRAWVLEGLKAAGYLVPTKPLPAPPENARECHETDEGAAAWGRRHDGANDAREGKFEPYAPPPPALAPNAGSAPRRERPGHLEDLDLTTVRTLSPCGYHGGTSTRTPENARECPVSNGTAQGRATVPTTSGNATRGNVEAREGQAPDTPPDTTPRGEENAGGHTGTGSIMDAPCPGLPDDTCKAPPAPVLTYADFLEASRTFCLRFWLDDRDGIHFRALSWDGSEMHYFDPVIRPNIAAHAERFRADLARCPGREWLSWKALPPHLAHLERDRRAPYRPRDNEPF